MNLALNSIKSQIRNSNKKSQSSKQVPQREGVDKETNGAEQLSITKSRGDKKKAMSYVSKMSAKQSMLSVTVTPSDSAQPEETSTFFIRRNNRKKLFSTEKRNDMIQKNLEKNSIRRSRLMCKCLCSSPPIFDIAADSFPQNNTQGFIQTLKR